MIYSGPFSVAKISAHGPGSSRIIPTSGKCSFNYSHGCAQCGSPWVVQPGDFLCFFSCWFVPHTHENDTGTWQGQERSLWQPMGLSDGSSWALERPNGVQTISGTMVQVSSEHFLVQVVHSGTFHTLEWVIMEYTPLHTLSCHTQSWHGSEPPPSPFLSATGHCSGIKCLKPLNKANFLK